MVNLYCPDCEYWDQWVCKVKGRCSNPKSGRCGCLTRDYQSCEHLMKKEGSEDE